MDDKSVPTMNGEKMGNGVADSNFNHEYDVTTEELNVDAALKTLGGIRSRYQQIMILLLALMEIPCAWIYLADAFSTDVPAHMCRTSNVTWNWDHSNYTGLLGDWVGDQCSTYYNQTSVRGVNASYKEDVGRMACQTGWVYDVQGDDTYRGSVIAEWDLVCDRAHLAQLMTTLFFAGDMVGALILPPLSDICGRRKIFLLSTFFAAPLSLATAFAPCYEVFVTLRFLTAFCLNGSFLTCWTLAVEYLTSKQRGLGTQIIYIFWALGLMSLAGVAYLVPDWRWIYISASILYIPIIIPIAWFIPESVHFYVANGRMAEAEAVILKVAKFNGIQLPGLHLEGAVPMKLEIGAAGEENKIRNHTLLSVITTRNLRLQAAICCLIWCINAMVYYGLSLHVTKMPGNKFLNFFITSIVEIPAYILVVITLHYFRRKIPSTGFFALSGVSLLLILSAPYMGKGELPAHLIFLTLAKLGATASFACIMVHHPELYPTVVRSSGLGIMSLCSRAGAMVAPFITSDQADYVTPVIFGSLALLGGLLVLTLPETYGRPLPEKLVEVESSWKRPLGGGERV